MKPSPVSTTPTAALEAMAGAIREETRRRNNALRSAGDSFLVAISTTHPGVVMGAGLWEEVQRRFQQQGALAPVGDVTIMTYPATYDPACDALEYAFVDCRK